MSSAVKAMELTVYFGKATRYDGAFTDNTLQQVVEKLTIASSQAKYLLPFLQADVLKDTRTLIIVTPGVGTPASNRLER
jgi:hypothetical protein